MSTPRLSRRAIAKAVSTMSLLVSRGGDDAAPAPDVFAKSAYEGNHVVVGCRLDLANPLRGWRLGAGLDRLHLVVGDVAARVECGAGRDLDLVQRAKMASSLHRAVISGV